MIDEITVVVTDRIGEIDPALALVHDGFVESGFMDAQQSRRRAIPQYFNPGTCFAIAMEDDVPVGVLTGVPDGPFGLPSEAVYPGEFAHLRELGIPVEGGSLTIARGSRGHNRQLLMMLFAAQLRVFAARPDTMVCITVAPEQEHFYRSMLGIGRVGEERDLYGKPALLLAGPIEDVFEWARTGSSILRRKAHSMLTEEDPSWLALHLGAEGGAGRRDASPVRSGGRNGHNGHAADAMRMERMPWRA